VRTHTCVVEHKALYERRTVENERLILPPLPTNMELKALLQNMEERPQLRDALAKVLAWV
jgi:hypothetical protein